MSRKVRVPRRQHPDTDWCRLMTQLHVANIRTLIGMLRKISNDEPDQVCDLTAEHENQLITELAKIFHEKSCAVSLIMNAGFPVKMIPSFSNPQAFWAKVVYEIRGGAMHGGLRPIIDKAAELYPANQVFSTISWPTKFN